MAAKLKTLDHRLLTRRCVGCGYDGSLLRGGQAQRCARCGCDLRKRPARSYAEMEGLLGQTITAEPAYVIRRHDTGGNIIHRWLFVFFMMMIGLIVFAALTAEALSSV